MCFRTQIPRLAGVVSRANAMGFANPQVPLRGCSSAPLRRDVAGGKTIATQARLGRRVLPVTSLLRTLVTILPSFSARRMASRKGAVEDVCTSQPSASRNFIVRPWTGVVRVRPLALPRRQRRSPAVRRSLLHQVDDTSPPAQDRGAKGGRISFRQNGGEHPQGGGHHPLFSAISASFTLSPT
jgi:hypothetical protein